MRQFISILKYLLSLGIAIALMCWVFQKIDFEVFKEKAKEVNYFWVGFSITISLLAYYARAFRWNILLEPLGYPKLSVHRTTLAIIVGYLANLAFPRLGEVTRCGMMKRSDDVAISTGFGTVVSERIIDLLTLILLLILALFLEHDQFISFFESQVFAVPVDTSSLVKLGVLLVILGVVGLGLLWLLANRVEKVKLFLLDLWRGLLSLGKIKNISGFILSTMVLWVVYYLMSYTIVYALPETSNLGWEVGIMLLVTGGIALALPVQGGFGTYHTLISAMLALYFVETNTGIFLATMLHTSQVLATAIYGGFALLISVIMTRKRNEKIR